MWQFLTKNNEDEEYEKMPDFENEQSMKAQPKVTEEASFDDEVVYAKSKLQKLSRSSNKCRLNCQKNHFLLLKN